MGPDDQLPPPTASEQSMKHAAADFRRHLPDLNTPRFITAHAQNAHEYAGSFKETQSPPWLYRLTKAWEELYTEPYKGVTNDGV